MREPVERARLHNVLWRSLPPASWLCVLLFTVLPCSFSLADVLATYSVASVQTGDNELPPASVLAGVSASSITGAGNLKPVGVEGDAFGAFVQSQATNFDSSGWPLADFNTQALEVTVAPPPGFQIRFESVEWVFLSVQNSMTVEVLTSRDGFAAAIDGPFTIPSNLAGEEPTSLTSFPLIAGPVTFRWYAYSQGDYSDSDYPYGGFADSNGFAVRFKGTLVPLPSIKSIQRMEDSEVVVTGSGIPNASYDVQETDTLTTMPQSITTVTANPAGTIQYIDSPGADVKTRFYRFKQQ